MNGRNGCGSIGILGLTFATAHRPPTPTLPRPAQYAGQERGLNRPSSRTRPKTQMHPQLRTVLIFCGGRHW